MWYDDWGKRSGDISVEVIPFDDPDFFEKFVPTEISAKVDDEVLPGFSKSKVRHWVVGQRGAGKSQLLQYLVAKSVREYKQFRYLPVLVNVSSDDGNLRLAFYKSLLPAILRAPQTLEKCSGVYKDESVGLDDKLINELKEAEKKFREHTRTGPLVDDYFTRNVNLVLERMGGYFQKILIIVDELDKFEADLVLNFLLKCQKDFETISKFNCVFVIAAEESWYSDITAQGQYNYYVGRDLRVPPVMDPQRARELLTSKAKSAGYHGELPFTDKAVERLIDLSDRRPRDIIRNAVLVLDYAAKGRLKSVGPQIVSQLLQGRSEDGIYISILKNSLDGFPANVIGRVRTASQDEGRIKMVESCYSTDVLRVNDLFRYREAGFTITEKDYRRLREDLLKADVIRETLNGIDLHGDLRVFFDLVKKRVEDRGAVFSVAKALRLFPQVAGKVRRSA